MRRTLAALGAGFLIAACGGSAAPAPQASGAASAQPASIKVSLPGLKPAWPEFCRETLS